MENKYFTPNITDLRVGYDCELFWNQDMLPENEWFNLTIGDKGTEDINWQFRIDKKEIKTPYLTKEQIEAEGWVYANSQKSSKGSMNAMIFDVYEKHFSQMEDARKQGGWMADGFIYNWKLYAISLIPYGIPYYEQIIIEQNTQGGFAGINETHTSYWGNCPSINELRYISKLLNIK